MLNTHRAGRAQRALAVCVLAVRRGAHGVFGGFAIVVTQCARGRVRYTGDSDWSRRCAQEYAPHLGRAAELEVGGQQRRRLHHGRRRRAGRWAGTLGRRQRGAGTKHGCVAKGGCGCCCCTT